MGIPKKKVNIRKVDVSQLTPCETIEETEPREPPKFGMSRVDSLNTAQHEAIEEITPKEPPTFGMKKVNDSQVVAHDIIEDGEHKEAPKLVLKAVDSKDTVDQFTGLEMKATAQHDAIKLNKVSTDLDDLTLDLMRKVGITDQDLNKQVGACASITELAIPQEYLPPKDIDTNFSDEEAQKIMQSMGILDEPESESIPKDIDTTKDTEINLDKVPEVDDASEEDPEDNLVSVAVHDNVLPFDIVDTTSVTTDSVDTDGSYDKRLLNTDTNSLEGTPVAEPKVPDSSEDSQVVDDTTKIEPTVKPIVTVKDKKPVTVTPSSDDTNVEPEPAEPEPVEPDTQVNNTDTQVQDVKEQGDIQTIGTLDKSVLKDTSQNTTSTPVSKDDIQVSSAHAVGKDKIPNRKKPIVVKEPHSKVNKFPFKDKSIEDFEDIIKRLLFLQNGFDNARYNVPSRGTFSSRGRMSSERTDALMYGGNDWDDNSQADVSERRKVLNSISNLYSNADILSKIEELEQKVKPQENLGEGIPRNFLQPTAIFGVYLLLNVSENSGCTDVDMGVTRNMAEGNVIVEYKDFPMVYSGFDTRASAEEYIKSMSSVIECSISEVRVSDDGEDLRYKPFKRNQDVIAMEYLDKMQVYQVWEDYKGEPHGIRGFISMMSKGKNQREPKRESYYNAMSPYGSSRFNLSNKEKKGNIVTRLFRSAKNTKNKIQNTVLQGIENMLVEAKSFRTLKSVMNILSKQVPRGIRRKILNGSIYYDEHVIGHASIAAYKILSLCLSRESGVRDILLGDMSGDSSGSLVVFEDFCGLRCTFINSDYADKFIDYFSQNFNVYKVR